MPGAYPAVLLAGAGIVAAVFPEAEGWRAAAVYLLAWLVAGTRTRADQRILIWAAPLTALSLALLRTDEPQLAFRQMVWLLCGAVLFASMRPALVGWFLARRMYIAALATLVLALTAFVGRSVGGSRSWLPLGAYAVQPIQFVQVLLIPCWAPLLSARDRVPLRAYALPLLTTFAALVTAAIQRDFGPVLVIVLTGMAWALAAGTPLPYVTGAALPVAAGGFLLVHHYPHLTRRFAAWLAPWDDPFDAGFQSVQARFALAHGRWSGNGWYGSVIDVPASATDLPLVGLVERIGLAGGLLVIGLLAGLVASLLQRAWGQTEGFERQLGVGCGLLLGVQALLACTGAVGITPVVGITLPLVSYGGSSLLATFLLLALGHTPSTGPQSRGKGAPRPVRALAWALPFGLLVGLPLVYWTLVAGPRLLAHPRAVALRMAVSAELRGGIVSRSGENLTTPVEPGMRLPVLPSLIHTVGYVHPRYGTAGLERTFDGALSRGITGGGVAAGATRVHTSIDLALQEVVEQALGDLTGAVVVLDPWSGAVLAMASSPRPAAGLVTSDALADERSPLLNRATQGLYPPGSAFKPVVLAAALEGGLVTSETRWDDGGSIVIDGYVVQNAGGRALGRLSPAEALALSSNVVFVRLAVALGPEPLRLQSHALGIGDQPGFEIPYRAGRLGSLQSSVQLAAAGIGQGDVLVTPLEMALVTSVIANGGYRVYPHLVTHFEAAGRLAAGVRTAPIRAVSPETAEILQEGLRKAVAEGTFAGRIDPSLLAGKTGTAENPHGEPHAWFIGFAPARQPAVAFAVLVENGGSGAYGAGPIAQRIAEYVASGAVGANRP